MNTKAIYSMTGFGKAEVVGENFTLTCEIKSVNNRFKDIKLKMSNLFNAQETFLRNQIEAHFRRGSFDVFINYKIRADKQDFSELDEAKIKNFITKMTALVESTGNSVSIRPTDFLRNEFQQDSAEEKTEELSKLLLDVFPRAVKALQLSRQEEGEKLRRVLMERVEEYEKHFLDVQSLAQTFRPKIEAKFREKFEQFCSHLKVDEPRFLQEVIYYLEKMDIAEEIKRTEIHLQKLRQLLEGGGEVGRQLDFLLQELGRETNTTGSKSALIEISENVVKMKVELEKMREQALNLE